VRSVNPQRIARGIPRALLYDPVLNDPDYIVGAGADNRVFLGAFLELLLIIANIGTAVALFPILKRQNESVALGYVTARVVECAFIAVGILIVLSVVTLRQEAAGADAGSLVAVGESLVAIHDRTSLLAPASLSRRERAVAGLPDVPVRLGATAHGRAGLVGGPLVCASGIAVMFGVFEAGSRVAGHRDTPGGRLGSTSSSRDSGLVPSSPWMRQCRGEGAPSMERHTPLSAVALTGDRTAGDRRQPDRDSHRHHLRGRDG
jgi:Domain of unknown function (DUF4386)